MTVKRRDDVGIVETDAALAMIAGNSWTALFVSHDGRIEELVPLPAELTAPAFMAFARTRAKGRRFRLMPQGSLSEAELKAIISDLVRPAEPQRSRKAGPSVLTDLTERRFWTPAAEARAIAEGLAALLSRRLP